MKWPWLRRHITSPPYFEEFGQAIDSDRLALEMLKRETLAMLRDQGSLLVVGGCCHATRAIAELIHEELVIESSDDAGRLLIAVTRRGLEEAR